MRIRAFGLGFDALSMEGAVGRILHWARDREGGCRYVVTPNVDHVVLYQRDAAFRRAVDAAALVLTDGKPVLYALRLLGHHVPGTVSGSDLFPALFAAAGAGGAETLRVFWLGAAPGVAERAAAAAAEEYPGIESVGTFSPPPGFEEDSAENRGIVERINKSAADLLIVGLGAPKQEIWAHTYRREIEVPVALCVGATIDFFAGEQLRAPLWMRKACLEWFYRVLRSPRRLAVRYLNDAIRFPPIFWKEWRSRE